MTQTSEKTLRDILLEKAEKAGMLAALNGETFQPPSYVADEMQTAWVRGWDKVVEGLKP